ncbi:MAG: hypothetical protein ACK5UE_00830 [Chitinophagales bacterium]|jgi:hypothetical protein|nr:hypothetical protein [Sphingobacteriales bacterium]
MIKKLGIILLLLIAKNSLGQNLEYKCRALSGSKIFLDVTPGSKPLIYNKKKVLLSKFTLSDGKTESISFYLYKYLDKLYILDHTATSLNHAKDQVLFSIPHQQYYKLDIAGFLENSTTVLNKSINLNGNSFYTYSILSPDNKLQATEIIFDKNLDINELKITAGSNLCVCTKTNITIRLK